MGFNSGLKGLIPISGVLLYVKMFRATDFILCSQRTHREHDMSKNQTKLVRDEDVSRTISDSTCTENGRVCTISTNYSKTAAFTSIQDNYGAQTVRHRS